ncbi:MAG: SDR family oxidoreductase [Euryarchaeota archaeon]|nr:SDR family oxidoreductase [Euryarchaeota archaeon]MDE1879560.1 SDR family oxidoreductase [Euryarchaeota archaeon]MDE2046075.1 SDR family oxidoreductase [Thermoplasmata archaeon]
MKPWSELFDLKGRAAIVTGSSMGIGEGIVRRLAAQGASVVVADIEEAKGKALAAELSKSGARSLFVKTDVRQVAQIRKLVEAAVKEFGQVDILVNNAGIFPFAPALDVSEELWDRVMGVNLRGSFFLAQAVAQQMKKQGKGGAIVNMASIDALHPTGQLSPYDASKGGLRMVTRSLALEWAPFGVRVNAIAPGSIATPGASAATAAPPGTDLSKLMEHFLSRIPLRRMGEPDDIARAALFLVSPAASYVTGVTMVVDGGYLLT